jgi:formylmethanofuran dehydrogenase subunit A
MKFTFGDIVVVDGENIGVVVKSWIPVTGPNKRRGCHHEVYVRMYNAIREYYDDEMDRYMVRHKFLSDEEKEYQHNAMNDL